MIAPGLLAPGLLVAAPRSGAGKTVLTAALLRAFAGAGLRVGGAKCGPDYLDPAFHAAASGRPTVNLDGFAFGPALAGMAAAAGRDLDLLVAEGAMGLYDGLVSPDGSITPDRPTSSAAIARALGWPVLLILDGSAAAQTVAAVAHGLATFPGAPRIAGAIVNRVASPRHRRLVEAGFAAIDLPLLGIVPTDAALDLPSRHLGLVQASEHPDLDARLDDAAALVAGTCDLPAIRAAAGPTAPAPVPPRLLPPRLPPPGQRIAVARDDAFRFLYPHLVQGWRDQGAEIAFFSPLADQPPPEDCDSCWLPGGYPELHAGRLAAAGLFLAGLRGFAATRPVHGECGGYMVLGRTLTDATGVVHAMAGLLPVDISFATRKLHLGYRRARWRRDLPFARAGTESVGHEYHHASVSACAAPDLADMRDGEGAALPAAGHGVGHVTGGFFHVLS